MDIREKLSRILAILNKAYGRPAGLKKSDPINELVRTVLSQNTTDKNSLKAFAALKRAFKQWDSILKTDARRISRIIRHAGLANIKAKRIKDIFAEIIRREGKINLTNLSRLDIEGALEYLKSLKGVGPKTAACVLLFSFGRPVMPVDTHIFRVAKRLGLLKKEANIDQAHRALSKIVPGGLIYNFHLVIIEHGRKTCKARNPKCGVCAVYSLCRFESKSYFKERMKN